MFYSATKAQKEKYLKKERALASYTAIQLVREKWSPADFLGQVVKGNKRKTRVWTHEKSLGLREIQVGFKRTMITSAKCVY